MVVYHWLHVFQTRVPKTALDAGRRVLAGRERSNELWRDLSAPDDDGEEEGPEPTHLIYCVSS